METGPIWSQLLLQVVLIALNAFFASAEIAILSINENKIRFLADEGDKKAQQLLTMRDKPEGFLSTIQIGITLAGFLASAFAASSFAEPLVVWLTQDVGVDFVSAATLNTICVVLITLILSFFTLVFGELVPKRVAMKKSDRVARGAVGVIMGIAKVTKPIVWLLSASTNGVLRLIGVNPQEDEESVTEEEIRMMVDIGEEEGAIASNEREMIENIFEFNNMSAEDVMTHRTDVTAIWIDDTKDEILSLIEQTGYSRFPVYDEDIDDIIGVVNTRDYLFNLQKKQPVELRRMMRPAYFVPESVRTDVLFRNMQKEKVHIAIVVDEYGGTSGIVTMEDLLEEIVGNIYDEFDPQAERDIEQLEENLWRVNGSLELDVLAETLDMTFPETDEFDTVGGLVFSQLINIPDDGAHPEVDVWGLHIRVEELTDRRVEWALVSKLDVSQEQPAQETEED